MEGEQLSLFADLFEDPANYFTRKRHWSASKHRIILKYIQAHCYNLGGNKFYQSQYINYVDGFAGKGKYEEGIGIEDFVNNSNFWANKYKHDFENTDGSPLIALKCARLFRDEKRVNLRCFFVEYKINFHKQLEQNCALIGEGLYYKIYEPQLFADALPKIMEELNNYPTLFFLDTFGVKGLTLEHLCRIGNYLSKNKGEVFLLFHNRQVARHAGQYKTNYENYKDRKQADSYTKNLTDLLGENSDQEWKQKWLELKQKPQEFEKWALEYFKERMRQETGLKGVTSFELKETYNDSRPQYSIVVGSNHPEKAFGSFLNEFVWEEEKLLFFKDNHQGIQTFLEKEWNAEQEQRIKEIKPIAIQVLHQIYPEWISFKDAITLLILERGKIGILKRKDYYKILEGFYREGRLQIKNPGSKKPYTLDSLFRFVEG